MFELMDIMIALAMVYLILSMAHKYLMSAIKRLLNIKATVIAEEMKAFIGENTTQYLIPHIEKNVKHLNILDGTRFLGRETGIRQLNKLKDMTK